MQSMFEYEEKEILDVVNADDEVVGQIERSQLMTLADKDDRYLRAVEIFIQRPNGDIYLPRRSSEKKLFPGGYDISAAGHIFSGESYSDACIREVKDEAGLDIMMDDLTFIKRVNPTPNLFYFRMLYLLRTDRQPQLSPEHVSGDWISPDKLEETVRADVPTKDTLYEDIPYLIDFLQRSGYDR